MIDMSSSNSWAEFAGIFLRTRGAYAEHERAKADLKVLVPEDATEASGHGIRARRSKAGAISFDVLETESAYAPVQWAPGRPVVANPVFSGAPFSNEHRGPRRSHQGTRPRHFPVPAGVSLLFLAGHPKRPGPPPTASRWEWRPPRWLPVFLGTNPTVRVQL